ncbi:hypothetical protein KP509_17G067300 [Ceratopteris richardii]|uniref:AN1-type domain-containing protein n=1 Tax=Ceratopteris richardii TaxID=49495 RepID=A0A8T2T0C0_CERRI|nr:hypothetical protein KP509_17G067300 [Ceratopteris richardii]
MNLCSSCYKALFLVQPKCPHKILLPLEPESSRSGCVPSSPSKVESPLRCFIFHKKVTLRGFKCRCCDIFCYVHRYSDNYSCSYDYKATDHASIAKANPLVKAVLYSLLQFGDDALKIF